MLAVPQPLRRGFEQRLPRVRVTSQCARAPQPQQPSPRAPPTTSVCAEADYEPSAPAPSAASAGVDGGSGGAVHHERAASDPLSAPAAGSGSPPALTRALEGAVLVWGGSGEGDPLEAATQRTAVPVQLPQPQQLPLAGRRLVAAPVSRRLYDPARIARMRAAVHTRSSVREQLSSPALARFTPIGAAAAGSAAAALAVAAAARADAHAYRRLE